MIYPLQKCTIDNGWLGLSAENRPKNDEAPRLLHFCIVAVEQTMHTGP